MVVKVHCCFTSSNVDDKQLKILNKVLCSAMLTDLSLGWCSG